jgi:hypothetical protein
MRHDKKIFGILAIPGSGDVGGVKNMSKGSNSGGVLRDLKSDLSPGGLPQEGLSGLDKTSHNYQNRNDYDQR